MARRPRELLQGLAVGARRRRGGGRRDPRQPRAEALRDRGRHASSGMEFERLEWDEQARQFDDVIDTVIIPCDDVILAIGQENAFPWIERDLGMEFGDWDMPVVDKSTFQSTLPGRLLRRRLPPGARRTSSGRSRTATRPRSRSTTTARAIPVTERPPQGMNLVSQKMGLTEWSYHNDYNPSARQQMTHVELTRSVPEHRDRGGAGLLRRADCARGAALPQLRHPDGVRGAALHRVRRVHRHLPGPVPDDHRERRGGRPADTALGAGEEPRAGALRLRGAAADGTRDGQGREPLRALRALRRTVPDCRVGHAEVRAADPATRSPHRCRWRPRSWLPRSSPTPRCQGERLRDQARQRERHRIGERQQPADAGDLPDGDAGLREEPLPLQHPGPADVVRDPGQQGRTRGARASSTTSWLP